MKYLTRIAAGLFFTLMVVSGLYAGSSSWKGVVYLSDGTIANSTRNPAAIQRDLDFSRLDGADLMSATQKRLITAANVIIHEGLVGVELGDFVTRDANGQRRLACDGTYNRLTLRFNAEGIASGGEKPAMQIDAPCHTSPNNAQSIEAVWIPVNQLLKSRAVNSTVEQADGSTLTFENMSGSWPVTWSLDSVRLYDSEAVAQDVRISATELQQLRPHSLMMNWREASRATQP